MLYSRMALLLVASAAAAPTPVDHTIAAPGKETVKIKQTTGPTGSFYCDASSPEANPCCGIPMSRQIQELCVHMCDYISPTVEPCCALTSRDAQARCVRDAGRLTPDLLQHAPPGMLPSGPDPDGPPTGGTAGPIGPIGGTAGPIGGTAGPMCTCFANSENDETYCESGNFLSPGACENTNGRCHWGPAELPQCHVGA